MSAFTVFSALAALPVVFGKANSYSSSKTLLNYVLWRALLDPLTQLIVPSSVRPQLFTYTSIMPLLLELAILFVYPTVSLRTRTNYLTHLCIPKTQSAWHIRS